MKREIKAREGSGWRRVDWALPAAPAPREMEVVHGRLVYLNPKACPRPAVSPLSHHRAANL